MGENRHMVSLFIGNDERETVGVHVFLHSLFRRASVPVAVTPLASVGLQQGTNQFTVSRFLVPYLMGFKGRAIFVDGADMLMCADIADLAKLHDDRYAVQVVKHDYKTRNPRKYVGTSMEAENRDYSRKNWASVMLFNCEHPAWAWASYAAVSGTTFGRLLQFKWCDAGDIGELPREWNCLADEGQPVDGAKILHWTAGIPGFPHYADAPGAALWHAERAALTEPRV
jgi:hypothetical protein